MSYSKVIFNKNALINNLEKLPSKNICAMVKADAYGCGVKEVCEALKNRVKFFGVSSLKEALQIRKFDKITPIIIVGYTQNFLVAIKNDISITVENLTQLKKIIAFSYYQKQSIKIHIKINTGMNRYGINNIKILKKMINKLKNNKKIIFEGIFTHFSFITNKKIFLQQFNLFQKYLKIIPSCFNPIKHIGGGDVLDYIDIYNFENYMVRVGYKLYCEGVITIKSEIIKIFKIKKNDYLGYSCGFKAKKNMRIAIVPLGYADGINRKLSNNACVKIGNIKCKIVGFICMDVFFVDITNVKCNIGDDVIVFDDAAYWAKICETIPYEILTSLNFSRMQKIVYNV